ncbi:MAG: cation transporter, partial [Bacteroidales bacterium]
MADHHHTAPHNHEHGPVTLNRAFIWGIILNTVFVIAEFSAGIISGSMSLLSDAGHNLSDIASLILAMLAFRLA